MAVLGIAVVQDITPQPNGQYFVQCKLAVGQPYTGNSLVYIYNLDATASQVQFINAIAAGLQAIMESYGITFTGGDTVNVM